jgi:magnesium-transporting ATPase (P-type)
VAQRWLNMAQEQAVTLSFLTLAFAQLWHVFDMRERGSSFARNDVTENAYVWGPCCCACSCCWLLCTCLAYRAYCG